MNLSHNCVAFPLTDSKKSKIIIFHLLFAPFKVISVYIQQYNTVRPHQALEYKTPESVYQSCFASQATDLDSLVLAG